MTKEIALYPQFSEIHETHRGKITNILTNFLPYCDFTFSNLYIWEIDGFKTQISILNNNLIIKTKNMRTKEIELSLIGNSDITLTIETLLNDNNKITLVPQQIINRMNNGDLLITEDVDNHDYILSTELISKLEGKHYHSKRKRVNKFLKEFPNHEVIILNSAYNNLDQIILEIYSKWLTSKGENFVYNMEAELTAIKKLLSIMKNDNKIEFWGLKIDNQIVAFTTIEYFSKDYAISSFAKSDLRYQDANVFLTHATSQYLFYDKNIKYINHEQDLGYLNLRTEKLSWRPQALLKKYSIRKK